MRQTSASAPPSSTRRSEDGQAMVEFVIAFPVQLFMTLALLQFALLVLGRIAVDHAAWYSARAALVACQPGGSDPQDEAERAAEAVMIPVSGRTLPGGGAPIVYPGWGPMDRSAAARAKTRATVTDVGRLADADKVEVEVEHHFELVIPVVNHLFVYTTGQFVYFRGMGSSAESMAVSRRYGTPHLVLRARRFIPKPWKDPR